MDDVGLFEVSKLGPADRGRGFQATGGAVEHLAIAELLSRGHKVAKPVVDDDGVDLIVDYCVRAQVKASSVSAPRSRETSPALVFHTTSGSRKPGEPYAADVFLFYDLRESRSSLSRFWVVPTSAMTLGGTVQLGWRFRRFQGAWDLFFELGAQRAA